MHPSTVDRPIKQRREPEATPAPSGARNGTGTAPGSRLARAFAEIERIPVPVALRDRARAIASSEPFDLEAFVAVCGGDLGLTLTVLRQGSRKADRKREVATVRQAAEVLGTDGLTVALESVTVYDPLAMSGGVDRSLQRARAHALQVRTVAVELATITGRNDQEEISTVALLHDLGRLVVTRLHSDYEPELEFALMTPERRLRRERRRYGIDHTLVGGVLTRRLDLPERMATAIERHHRPGLDRVGDLIGVADQIAHYRAGNAVTLEDLRREATEIGVSEAELRRILSGPELPGDSVRIVPPCPLSGREMDALSLLADGKVYKQIAEEMQVSVSTVRSHLHSTYRKLDVVDRAQAVLKSTEYGWI